MNIEINYLFNYGKVFFVSVGYTELVAIFNSEETYNLCILFLAAEARRQGYTINKSIVEGVEISELI